MIFYWKVESHIFKPEKNWPAPCDCSTLDIVTFWLHQMRMLLHWHNHCSSKLGSSMNEPNSLVFPFFKKIKTPTSHLLWIVLFFVVPLNVGRFSRCPNMYPQNDWRPQKKYHWYDIFISVTPIRRFGLLNYSFVTDCVWLEYLKPGVCKSQYPQPTLSLPPVCYS